MITRNYKGIALFFMFLTYMSTINAQFFEMGLNGGVVKYIGDLTPKDGDIEINPVYGAYISYHFNKRTAFHAGLSLGTLSGSDENNPDDEFRKRNLSFKSQITEFSFMQELYLLPYHPRRGKQTISPYISGGVAFYYFKPQAYFQGKWHSLQYLGTEGQGLVEYPERRFYSLLQIGFPVSVGIKYSLNAKANVGFSFGYRFTVTDYLDDIGGDYPDPELLIEQGRELSASLSNRTPEYTGFQTTAMIGKPRGNPDDNDSYYMIQLFFSYNFYDAFPFAQKKERRPRYRIRRQKERTKWF